MARALVPARWGLAGVQRRPKDGKRGSRKDRLGPEAIRLRAPSMPMPMRSASRDARATCAREGSSKGCGGLLGPPAFVSSVGLVSGHLGPVLCRLGHTLRRCRGWRLGARGPDPRVPEGYGPPSGRSVCTWTRLRGGTERARPHRKRLRMVPAGAETQPKPPAPQYTISRMQAPTPLCGLRLSARSTGVPRHRFEPFVAFGSLLLG